MTQPSPLQHLWQTVDALARAGSADVAFTRALDAALEAAGADMGAAFRPSGASLRLQESRNLPHALRKRPPLLTTARWTAAPVVCAPGAPAPDAPLEEAAPLANLPTWATLPVKARGTVHGLLLVASRDLVGFTPDALAQLQITATVLGLALSLPAPLASGPPPVPTQVGPAPDDDQA